MLARKVSEEYALLLRRLIPGLSALGIDDIVKAIRESPGFEEEIFLRILASLYARRDVDYVVIDTPPTGVAVRVVLLPKLYVFWVNRLIELRERIVSLRYAIAQALGRKVKPSDPVLEKLEEMKNRYTQLWDEIRNSQRTSFIIVATPEPLPVYEARMVVDKFRSEKLNVEAIVANRVLGPRAKSLGLETVEARALRDLEELACSLNQPASIVKIMHVEKPPSRLEDVAQLEDYIEVVRPVCRREG
ncbi:ArsA family ATPase [Hyperthermus butylicus]|uniref:Anion-transporting ATPase n=1 Tax=Hyperthermus butylicus (strain DSM 5456 / JCM 9403 / PLM1-5) TaxID=415426 RepID=A2BKZ8_HYPBU|nr:ArsA-related P-loop ATPase [Hyperthermus butylicus]ABM80659.1 Anion-transporting ATPase [Hyperthermus butylicus DSM 5456]